MAIARLIMADASGEDSLISAAAFEREEDILCLISDAAAFVKVTMSISSRFASPLQMREDMRPVSAAVFPLPAAAERSRFPPRQYTAVRWAGV